MTSNDTPKPFDPDTGATLLVEEIVAALVNSRIYANSHPRVQNSLSSVRRTVQELASESKGDSVRIASADGMIVYQQRPLLGASIGAARLVELLRQWGSGGVQFAAGVEVRELEELFALLVARPLPGQDYVHLNQQLVARQVRNAALLPPYVEGGGTGNGDRGTNDREGGTAPTEPLPGVAMARVGLKSFQAVIDLLENVTVSVCRGGRIDFAPVQEQAEKLLQQLHSKDEPLMGLAREDQYDAFTFGHSMRVALLAMNFARALTDDQDLLIRIGTAGLLHDVGKALIPFEILHSTRALSEEERRQMNRHAELGAECLLSHDDSDPLAIAAAFGHHRAPDGSGYPRTTHRHETDMVTSIVKICDVFEALTAARPYKLPMSPIRAYRVMLAMGDKLDRQLLRRFIEVNGIYPVGQLVELSTGEVAVVRAQSKNGLQPTVALMDSMLGQDVITDDQRILDLSDVACCSARTILRELTPDEAKDKFTPQ